jgi:hypothetical protein
MKLERGFLQRTTTVLAAFERDMQQRIVQVRKNVAIATIAITNRFVIEHI